ncbi:MAG: hypothetical protein WAN51_12390, partial [Alphaproteobacteria bacterium]
MLNSMEQSGKRFWIAVGLWASTLVTVLGCALYAFVEHSPYFGALYSVVGLVGLIYMTVHLKGKRLGKTHATSAVLVLTWAFIGYVIWDNYNQKPTTPPPTTPINQPPSVDEIAKITAPFQTEIASLKHQLETARQMPATPAQATPAHSGSPITWDDNFN